MRKRFPFANSTENISPIMKKVKLYLEIKNIPNMTIKIFEFSSEDYYLKKNTEISGEINIDGLIANQEIYIEFKEPPQRKVIKEFKFDNITNKNKEFSLLNSLGSDYHLVH